MWPVCTAWLLCETLDGDASVDGHIRELKNGDNDNKGGDNVDDV